ncbi:chondroadherin [Hippocampus comes]|uniref:chondroadherin n=1 Tax=Hippocampus comes TaxID=109280 RepID=UPI00094EBC45|nr:PREDICTED: chondroadherin [Hippocampus comes]
MRMEDYFFFLFPSRQPLNGGECSAERVGPPGDGSPPTRLLTAPERQAAQCARGEDDMRRVSCLLLLLASVLMARGAPGQCPTPCHCHGDLQHVICDAVGLKKIPQVSASTRLLNLQRNPLGGVPAAAFADSGGLVSLHMQHCQLRHIATNAFKGLSQLVYLYLSHNHITSIQPDAFRDLSRLTYLHLDHNRISELAKGIFSPLVNLFVLRLDDNKLRQLRPGTFAGAKDLRWLHLSGNQMSTLHAGSLEDVENLAVLHLDRNKLAVYPAAAMSKLRVVEELALGENPMKSIPERAFSSFGRYMEKLQMDRMGLEKMSEEAFAGVTALTSLDVSNNKLRWLPKSLDLSRVTNLTVANNPWSCTCQLAPLRRWMDGNSRKRTDAACASPPAQRGKQVRDSAAFAACRLKPKRSKTAARH